MVLDKFASNSNESKESSENIVQVRVIGGMGGGVSEPFKARVVGMGINAMNGRPEIKYQKVGGTSQVYVAEWQTAEDNGKKIDGWMAYPMD